MSEVGNVDAKYSEWLNKFEILESDVDYSIFEKHKPFLNNLATVSNSGIIVFDFCKQDFVYASYNFGSLLGYDLNEMEKDATNYFNSRMHPQDFIENRERAIAIMKFYDRLPTAERPNYKFVYEYRVLGSSQQYVRVIVQYQHLEPDKKGNTWLAIGIMDVSPDQTEFQGVKTQVLNFKTGEIGTLDSESIGTTILSKREKEILSLIKEGFLSKEISDKLFISLHTVNTHRQRILEKLNANNSVEAVTYASRLGLLA